MRSWVPREIDSVDFPANVTVLAVQVFLAEIRNRR